MLGELITALNNHNTKKKKYSNKFNSKETYILLNKQNGLAIQRDTSHQQTKDPHELVWNILLDRRQIPNTGN